MRSRMQSTAASKKSIRQIAVMMLTNFDDGDDGGNNGKLPLENPLVLVMLTVSSAGQVGEKSSKSNLFLTLHLVQQLLLRRYRVRVAISSPLSSTVSNIKDTEKAFQHLSGGQDLLEVVNIDEEYSNLDYSFSADVVSVFLVSWNAVFLKGETFDTNLIQRVEKILYMCQNVKSVKSLVITSCVAALVENYDISKVYTEADWNVTATPEIDPYGLSKVTVEKRALEFASAPHCSFRVATILPGLLLGPHLVPGCNAFGYKFLIRFINSYRVYPNFSYLISDVRDVAIAHIVAMENAEAKGRFIVGHKAMHLSVVLQTIHENFHDLRVSNYLVRDFVLRARFSNDTGAYGQYVRKHLGKVLNIDNRRAKEAGMVMRPAAQTIVETVRYIMENNLLSEHNSNNAAKATCRIS